MIGVINRLMVGDQRIAERFAQSKAFWDEFHPAHRDDDEETLARALGVAQSAYEDLWNWDRYLAKTSMPFTAVAALYDDTHGFADNRDYAARLLRAFRHHACMCSGEVKSYASDAAALYTPEG